VERIEQLETEHREIMAGFRTHYADRNPKKLEEEQSRYFAKLQRAERGETASPMPVEIILTFPGFVNHRKGPVS
jgi:hypothetical protein